MWWPWAGTQFSEALQSHHNAFVYVIQGTVNLTGFAGEPRVLQRDDLGILAHGERVSLTAGDETTRFLLLAGRPLNEPVARGGPFVMNTRAEIQQAMEDYAAGKL